MCAGEASVSTVQPGDHVEDLAGKTIKLIMDGAPSLEKMLTQPDVYTHYQIDEDKTTFEEKMAMVDKAIAMLANEKHCAIVVHAPDQIMGSQMALPDDTENLDARFMEFLRWRFPSERVYFARDYAEGEDCVYNLEFASGFTRILKIYL